ncbi:MAG TPA: glycosyltransferase N-terminal domain-containing protein, partial [Gemmatimonadaceae bacterium]|nr:glycosyltransferase N-terminal domain-containing protein [Gemmatimonadaceae bacterium]
RRPTEASPGGMNQLVRPFYLAAGLAAQAAASVIPSGGGKLRRSLAARRGAVERFERWATNGRDPARPLCWVHAPSVGEGLQARPVLEQLRHMRPELQLAYTYFSPSAADFSRRLDVDFVDVLPFDTARGADRLLDALRPTALVFSKLDVWPMLAERAARVGVGLGLISATLPESSSRLRGLSPLLLRDAYSALDAVGAISETDAHRLIELGCSPAAVSVTGDTRFDQVWDRAAAADRSGSLLAPLRSTRPTLVAGSTWPADERVLLPAVAELRRASPELRLVIAPHEPHAGHVAPLERWGHASGARVTRLGAPDAGSADVVVVDRVGVLGELYALADIAFVGGAFHGAGIHSVLEPAAYGVPIVFGPRHANSREASLLISAGAACEASDADQLRAALAGWIGDLSARRSAGLAARALVENHRGATARSVALIEGLLAAGGGV